MTMSEEVRAPTPTGGVGNDEPSNASLMSECEEHRDAWQQIIDRYLVEWGRNPNQLEEEGLITPSPRILRLAATIAMQLRDGGYAAPLRVVPDGEGGIAFERRAGAAFESLVVQADGVTQFDKFVDCRLVMSVRLPQGALG